MVQFEIHRAGVLNRPVGNYRHASPYSYGFHDQTKRPIAWMCSVCETVFTLDRVDAILTKKSTEQINKDFEMHCMGQHPGSQIIGLDIPHEDVSQALPGS